MITIDSSLHGGGGGGGVGPPQMQTGGVAPPPLGDLPTAYVTSTPLPSASSSASSASSTAKAAHHHHQQQHQHQQQHHLMHHPHPHQNHHQNQHQQQLMMMSVSSGSSGHGAASGGISRGGNGNGNGHVNGQMSEEDKAESEKNAIISSLFEEIRLEATFFGSEAKEEQPAPLPPNTAAAGNKKLKKRKSELALQMTADDVDDILGDSSSTANFNPKNPFGPSPPNHHSNGFADLGSPGSSSFSQKSSPPLTKYSQNNQGQRGSPPSQAGRQFAEMSPYMTPQMNSPHHPQLQSQNSMTSTPPPVMHSPAQQVPEFKPTIINGVVMTLPHLPPHLPHHTRLLQHQQSAPNLRQGAFDDLPPPHTLGPVPGAPRPFDRSLVEEFNMCVQAVLMASSRVCCRHVYRQLTAEVSELYARVAKNQVPKKAVKKIIGPRTQASHGERIELERQFKCLSDGLESRQSSQLYESILHFLYKMRVAIPDSTA